MHHIPFVDDVLLPFEPKPPSLLSPRLPLPRNVVPKRNNLSPYKPMLEIRMNNPRSLRRSRPLPHRPSPHFLRPSSEVSEQPQQRISPPDNPVQPRLLLPQLRQKLGPIPLIQLRNLSLNSRT